MADGEHACVDQQQKQKGLALTPRPTPGKSFLAGSIFRTPVSSLLARPDGKGIRDALSK